MNNDSYFSIVTTTKLVIIFKGAVIRGEQIRYIKIKSNLNIKSL